MQIVNVNLIKFNSIMCYSSFICTSLMMSKVLEMILTLTSREWFINAFKVIKRPINELKFYIWNFNF